MNIFTYIKERIGIVDVVREYVTLKPAGVYLKGSCPFHSERTASFTVSPHKEIFYCFGCHTTGDVIGFIAQIEHCSQLEAAKLLADRFNIELPSSVIDHKQLEESSEKERYFDLCAQITAWCQQQLTRAPLVKQYLQDRRLNAPVIAQFKLGFFPAGATALRQLGAWLQKGGFLLNDLAKYHIVIEGQQQVYSPFENRLLFPIADHLGRICGFGGRVVKQGDERAKYYNSKENTYFTKGSILFGLDAAKKAIQQSGRVFLVEGYMDCLAMVQHGFNNCVATLGTACTSEHLTLLARYADEVYVVYDGDQAGVNAVLRLTELCWNANLNVKIISLPVGQDPASFLGAGQSLTEYIERAQDVFAFFINYMAADFESLALKKKMTVASAIVDMIVKIDDPIKRELLMQQASHSLKIPVQALQSVQKQVYGPVRVRKAEAAPVSSHCVFSDAEKYLFCLIMEHPALMVRDDIATLVDVMSEPLQAIVFKRVQGAGLSFVQYVQLLSEQERQLTYALVMAHDKASGAVQEHAIRELIRQQWKDIVRVTKQRIAQVEQDDPEQVGILVRRLQDLKQKIFGGSV